jgi:lysosomal acid lipase/cholesteryl ester hydrolase
VNVFVALAPAMTPPGLAPSIVDGLIKSSPTLIFLFFGRRSILSSTILWRDLLYAPIYTKVIDASIRWLFGWDGKNISAHQKMAAYSHLYSFASVKAVVHWFQIMRSEAFIMYDDDAAVAPSFPSSYYHHERHQHQPGSPSPSPSRRLTSYRPARFPTRNIGTPIVLLYGDRDGLVDVSVLEGELPEVGVEWVRLRGYEHLDVLWGSGVGKEVIPRVVEALEKWGREEDGELIHVKG